MAIAVVEITQAIWDAAHRIEKGVDVVTAKAKVYVEAEKIYKIALAKETIKLKTQGMPVTLIKDIARGNIADLKYNRDLSEQLYRTSKEMLESLRAELTALQSILKVQSDI